MTNFAQFDAAEVFDMAIQTERNGKAFYEAAAAAATSPDVRSLLSFLADAEANHEQTFRAMKVEAGTPAPPESYPGEREEYVQALLRSRVLSDEAAGKQALARMASDAEALDFAIAFEKDTILFMYEMRDILPERERERMEVLIEQERTHVRVLQEMKARAAE